MSYKRKLIEVALPLEAINQEAAREKSIRHGHPSTVHMWWARLPLAAARAVLFAQLVDDPSSRPDEFPTEADQELERKRLFDLIERLVPWEASNDESVLAEARAEIWKSCNGHPPPILDPFAGGGTIPLEAQRLGLEAHASDLNPVAVLINKALIEIPPKFANMPPVNPDDRDSRLQGGWHGAEGLAADVRYYGKWMRDEAERRIGHLYPKAKLPDGGEATVIAWIWARTVRCPNPACGIEMPLVRSFWLGKKKGKEAYVVPRIENGRVVFSIGNDAVVGPRDGTVGRTGAVCLSPGCDAQVPLSYVRAEGKAGRIGVQLMAIAAEGPRQRIYLPPNEDHERVARLDRPADVPDTELPEQALGFRVQGYGVTAHADLFTNRQLVAIVTLCDLVSKARRQIRADAGEPGVADTYADSIATYLALVVSRTIGSCSNLVTWNPDRGKEGLNNVFKLQTVSMVWDFGEANIFQPGPADVAVSADWVSKALECLPKATVGVAEAHDAARRAYDAILLATDPPYYDNVGYADLSDFFYIWLRRSLKFVYPQLLGTMLTPKTEELVADPFRHRSDREAQQYFESGFERVFRKARESASSGYPITVFYAFKQAENDNSSTGWETLLAGMLRSGWSVTATWPMRTQRKGRPRESESNALASSIVLACRPRPEIAGVTDRRGFVNALRAKLPDALRDLQQGAIAPVDLAQAAIGPGMAVYSSYAKVVEPSGEPMGVRTALGLINQVLDEVLAEQEGEFDPATRWAVKWFEQYGYNDGSFGTAEVLAKAQAVAIGALQRAGIVRSKAGKVALLGHEDMPGDWDPATDPTLTAWGVVHQLLKRLDEGGEDAAGALLKQVGGMGEVARDLAYRLYTVADRKGWSTSAQAFNGLVTSWRDIVHAAERAPAAARTPATPSMFEG